jgi:hypothetical protein
MTVPSERSRAVLKAYKFLLSLLDPKKTPRVPKDIRKEAGRILKHYPGEFYIEQSSKHLPEFWGDPKD